MFTLCVPTKNRPQFVARLLRYYAQVGYRHWIFIGDSSDEILAQHTQRIIQSFDGTLRLRYFGHPGLNVAECLERLSQAASTPYCGWVGDDDFLCTRSIDRCIACLEESPDYAAAQGLGILFQISGSGPQGPMSYVTQYPHAALEACSAAERLREHLMTGLCSLHTAVRRTEQFREMVGGFGRMPGARQGFIFDDLIPHCLAALQGKVKILDCLYLVRHAHEGIYRQVNAYDWVTDPTWWPSYQVFRDRVVAELVRYDGVTNEQAEHIIKDTFWPYLANTLTHSWQNRQARSTPSSPARARRLAKRIPGLQRAWGNLRAAIQRWQNALSLPALLTPTSPYHDDFMPVYRVVTTPPSNGIEGQEWSHEVLAAAMAVPS